MGIEVISAIPESANDGFAMAIDGVWEGLQATPRLHGRLHLRKAMKGCGEAQFFSHISEYLEYLRMEAYNIM